MEKINRNRIYSPRHGKMNDDDRTAIAAILIKAGYTVRVGAIKPQKGQTQYFIEFWEEDDGQKQAGMV